MNIKKIFSVAIFSLMLATTFAGCGENYDKNVLVVRDGVMDDYPNIPIGKAFDQFFGGGQWKSFTSTKNETIVEFNGDCTWNNVPATLTMQFTVNGIKFEVNYVAINGVAMSYFESLGIIEKILSEYKP